MDLLIRPARAADAVILHYMMSDLASEVLPEESFRVAFLKDLADDRVGYCIAESSGEAVGR